MRWIVLATLLVAGCEPGERSCAHERECSSGRHCLIEEVGCEQRGRCLFLEEFPLRYLGLESSYVCECDGTTDVRRWYDEPVAHIGPCERCAHLDGARSLPGAGMCLTGVYWTPLPDDCCDCARAVPSADYCRAADGNQVPWVCCDCTEIDAGAPLPDGGRAPSVWCVPRAIDAGTIDAGAIDAGTAP